MVHFFFHELYYALRVPLCGMGASKSTVRTSYCRTSQYFFVGQWPKTGVPGVFLANNGCT